MEGKHGRKELGCKREGPRGCALSFLYKNQNPDYFFLLFGILLLVGKLEGAPGQRRAGESRRASQETQLAMF